MPISCTRANVLNPSKGSISNGSITSFIPEKGKIGTMQHQRCARHPSLAFARGERAPRIDLHEFTPIYKHQFYSSCFLAVYHHH